MFELRTFSDDCPITSVYLKRIGEKCYFLGPTQETLDDAQDFCLSRCGLLAEPDLTLEAITALHTGFKTAFADEIALSNS